MEKERHSYLIYWETIFHDIDVIKEPHRIVVMAFIPGEHQPTFTYILDEILEKDCLIIEHQFLGATIYDDYVINEFLNRVETVLHEGLVVVEEHANENI